jgi:hypothetical protein
MSVNVFVTGTIRSGTTFVGKALASARDSIYIHEPFNPDSPWNSAIPTPISHFYISDHNALLYRARLGALLKLQPNIRGQWLESVRQDRNNFIEKSIPDGSSRESLNKIIKDPLGIFCTEWLVRRWDLKPVLVVRDPREVIKSIFRMSWHKNLQPRYLLVQPQLRRRLFAMEEQLGLSNCISLEISNDNLTAIIRFLKPSYLALLYFATISGFRLLCYERSTLNPEIEFNRLFKDLDLPMGDEFKNSLSEKNNTFDTAKSHQNTFAPVSVERIKLLRSEVPDEPAVDNSVIVDAFADIRLGFADLVDWWD